MANTLIESVVSQLQHERARLEEELHRVTTALATFGKAHGHVSKPGPVATSATSAAPKRRTMSAAGRRRIAAAQKARWARVRAAQK